MKEEKEVLEHFAGVFTMMNPLTFKEIFQTTVPYMVERISKNYALQVFCLFVFPPIGNNQPVENSLFLKVRILIIMLELACWIWFETVYTNAL